MNKKCPRLAASLDGLKYDKILSSMKLQDFIEFAFQTLELGPGPVRPIMRCLFIEQSKTFTIPVEIKTGKLFFYKLTISITRIQTKKKTY